MQPEQLFLINKILFSLKTETMQARCLQDYGTESEAAHMSNMFSNQPANFSW